MLEGLVGAVGGSLISAIGGHSANRAAAKQAQLNRQFQERMSSTAHQREVKDLRAAGLNPILSATKGAGASTPAGATAQQKNPFEGVASSAAQMANMLAQTKLLKAQTEKTQNEANLTAPKANIFEKLGNIVENVLSGNNHSAKQTYSQGGVISDELRQTLGAGPKKDVKVSFPNSPKDSVLRFNSEKKRKYMQSKGYKWSNSQKRWIK